MIAEIKANKGTDVVDQETPDMMALLLKEGNGLSDQAKAANIFVSYSAKSMAYCLDILLCRT
jgi:hypothetical protein